MSSVKIRTTKVSKDALRRASGLNRLNVAPDGGFLATFECGDSATLKIYLPDTLQMLGPDELYVPFRTYYSDLSGALARQMGEQYADSVLGMCPLKLLDAAEPIVAPVTSAEATHILVHVRWPLGAAPEVTAEQRETLGTIFFARSEDEGAFGMDTWLVPMEVLAPDVIEDLAVQDRLAEFTLLQTWRVYELEKPYYKARMEELFAEKEQLREVFRMAEDYIVLKDGDQALSLDEDLHMPFWYNERGVDAVCRFAAVALPDDSHCPMEALFGGMPPISVVVMGHASPDETTNSTD